MRKAFPVSIPVGQSWPTCIGGDGGYVTQKYSWIRLDNRGTADVAIGTSEIPTSDPARYWDYVAAGRKVVRNFGAEHDDLPDELNLTNVGVTVATLWVEIADHPIVDIGSPSSAAGVQRTVAVQSTQGTPTTAAIAATSFTVLAANATSGREQATFFLESAATVYLLVGAGPASLTAYTAQLSPSNPYYELPGPGIYQGLVTAIGSSATGNLRVTELT